MAVGDIPVDGEGEGFSTLIPHLHLGAVGDAVCKDGGDVIQVAHLQGQVQSHLSSTSFYSFTASTATPSGITTTLASFPFIP